MLDQRLDGAYNRAIEKIVRNSELIGARYPHVVTGGDGIFNNESPSWWTNGFWGGLLWFAYDETKEEKIRDIAEKLEEKLDEVLNDFTRLDHDMGFIWLPTAVQNYKSTQNEVSRRRGLIAASHLAGRFNLAGQFIRAWNGDDKQGWAIIDCVMNLPLLYWASKETGDPRFYHIAKAHANTVLKMFTREDGTVVHIVNFDPITGEKIEELGGQGYAFDSVWARGQAWAIYGLALTARETGEKQYLESAKKLARYFMTHLPEDDIPCWDFKAPEETHYAKDASAACCTASGLIEIASLVADPEEKTYFIKQAERLLVALMKECSCFDDSCQGIIKNGTVHFPANYNINVPIIYSDFFFVEALRKLKGKVGVF